jgi:3'-phosphoadenosine 5'-phosphosulfate sulfotransferase (PAPS reductase)/FAD synthetase
MSNPYHIDGPALIQVSGGRTSGFMLRKILDAHGGTLPDDVRAVFQNTGKEHEATLAFLKEMSERWSVPITWLEFTFIDGVKGFKVVDYCKASRNGEPFAAAIKERTYLPNPMVRFCTVELKIRTSMRYAKSLGWREINRVVGIRADEPRRVARMKGDNTYENVVLPMAKAGHTEDDVLAFWKSQPFDLMLPGGDNTFGNCDLCFLKGRAKIDKIIRTNPESALWWAEQEERAGRTFRIDRPTYRQMLTQITVQGQLYDDAVEDDTLPCQCTD